MNWCRNGGRSTSTTRYSHSCTPLQMCPVLPFRTPRVLERLGNNVLSCTPDWQEEAQSRSPSSSRCQRLAKNAEGTLGPFPRNVPVRQPQHDCVALPNRAAAFILESAQASSEAVGWRDSAILRRCLLQWSSSVGDRMEWLRTKSALFSFHRV